MKKDNEMIMQDKPNIVFILVDDMGWMDSSVYGSQYYETPNMERLAKRGMVFTDAYCANPLCSPTRASLMTGKYPARIGITKPHCHMTEKENDENYRNEISQCWRKVIDYKTKIYLPTEEYTLGNAFKDAGYATGIIGKWHLGRQKRHWPRNQGFDLDKTSYLGWPTSYFSPYGYISYEIDSFPDGPDGEHICDRVTDEGIRFVKENMEHPFLLLLWYFDVHCPYQAREELIQKYKNKQDPRGRQDCAVMGAMLETLDYNVGRVIDSLDDLGLSENTMIIFLSDNGGSMYSLVDETTATNNYPLRSGKANIHEGGVRVPCIISWPGHVEPGTTCTDVISSIDFYPTLLDAASIKLNPNYLVDGESFLPLLHNTGKMSREAIFCHYPHYIPETLGYPCTSVRKGDWKLIRNYGEGKNFTNSYELYNLKEDIGEDHNLADSMPELVKELDCLIDMHLLDVVGFVPYKSPHYDPQAKISEIWEKVEQMQRTTGKKLS